MFSGAERFYMSVSHLYFILCTLEVHLLPISKLDCFVVVELFEPLYLDINHLLLA